MRRFILVLAFSVLIGGYALLAGVDPAQAGRIGGPSTVVVFVPAYDSVYVDAPFAAGEIATVTAAGDGNANLELFLYDADGHISPALGYGDRKIAMMSVYRAGFFAIEVRNRGPWGSNVVMTTN